MQRFPDHSAQPSAERVTYANHRRARASLRPPMPVSSQRPSFVQMEWPLGSGHSQEDGAVSAGRESINDTCKQGHTQIPQGQHDDRNEAPTSPQSRCRNRRSPHRCRAHAQRSHRAWLPPACARSAKHRRAVRIPGTAGGNCRPGFCKVPLDSTQAMWTDATLSPGSPRILPQSSLPVVARSRATSGRVAARTAAGRHALRRRSPSPPAIRASRREVPASAVGSRISLRFAPKCGSQDPTSAECVAAADAAG